MTVREAILTLNANAVFACERAGFASATVQMIEDALDIIEDALKAQEPVEPDIRKLGFTQVYFCGTCKLLLCVDNNFCPNCGRKVKWE